MTTKPQGVGRWQQVDGSRKVVYETRFMRVIEDDVIDPTGKKTIYSLLDVKGVGAGIIPVTEEGNIFLVTQDRYGLGVSLEIISGRAKEGENPLETAKRELKEEAGIEALRYDLICEDLWLMAGSSNAKANIYIARNLIRGFSSPDEGESLRMEKVSIDEAVEKVTNGTIKDIVSIGSIFLLKEFFSKHKNEFVWKEEGV